MAEREIAHCLTLDGRKKLTMTGVTEVVSFDDGLVVLRTELGKWFLILPNQRVY